MKLALSVLLCSSVALYGQQHPAAEQQKPTKIGGYLGYQYNLHNAGFSQLPGVPSCCPEFQAGTGAGFAVGGLYEIPLSSELSLLLRGGYSSLGATLKETENIGNALGSGGSIVSAEVEHYLETTLGVISLQPGISYSPFNAPISFTVGLEAGYLAVKQYKQREVLVRPENAIFPDTRSGIRNESSGDIADASSLRLAGFAGITTEIPIGKNVTLSPSLEYFQGFTNVISDSSWGASSVRLATAVKFALVPAPEPAPPVEPVKPTPEPVKPDPVVAKESVLTASIALSAVVPDGRKEAVQSIIIEETELEEHVPVLFHIFFGENSGELPAQPLHLITREETPAFNENTLQADAMAVYPELLNILGARMKKNTKMTVTLTGCNADIGAEKGNTQLSRQRAEAVKAYLTSVWGIEPGRIAVKARNLPAKPSNTALVDGQEENRRVEIIAEGAALTDPVKLKDISRVAQPSSVEIAPIITADAGLKNWTLSVSGDQRTLASFNGTSTQPVVWNINPETVTDNTANIAFTLTASDRDGKTRVVADSIPARTLTLQKKRFEIRNDTRYEKFSLILFGYNETELDEVHRSTLEQVKTRITPQSIVTIQGYTDRTGDPAYNRQLAARRCENVRSYLAGVPAKNTSINAVGSDVLLFNNDTPYGRSYSRTVQVIVETPVQ